MQEFVKSSWEHLASNPWIWSGVIGHTVKGNGWVDGGRNYIIERWETQLSDLVIKINISRKKVEEIENEKQLKDRREGSD